MWVLCFSVLLGLQRFSLSLGAVVLLIVVGTAPFIGLAWYCGLIPEQVKGVIEKHLLQKHHVPDCAVGP